MSSNNRNETGATRIRDFMALCTMLAMGLGLMATPLAAAPFAYVMYKGTSFFATGSVSVIDTATNMVVAVLGAPFDPVAIAVTPDGKRAYVVFSYSTGQGAVVVSDITTNPPSLVAQISVGFAPTGGIAVAPDGKHAYVTNQGDGGDGDGSVSVIDTASNIVVATVLVGQIPQRVAVTPDGKHLYVTMDRGSLSVIDTASNTVAATVAGGGGRVGLAVTPDGKHVYAGNAVIDTASNTVVAGITGGLEVAITPDGKHAYFTDGTVPGTVSVFDTFTNTMVGTPIPVGDRPIGVAVTPDGKHAYVTNDASTTVSVIDTATNTVVATVPVGNAPFGVAIVPPPPGVPFLAFGAALKIAFGTAPNTDAFALGTSFTLSSTAPAFNPLTDPVTLQIGTFAVTIPSGSFHKNHQGDFVFSGVVNGVTLKAAIKSTGTLRYNFQAGAQNASLTGTQNSVYVTLAIGGGSFSNSNSGATSVTAQIFH